MPRRNHKLRKFDYHLTCLWFTLVLVMTKELVIIELIICMISICLIKMKCLLQPSLYLQHRWIQMKRMKWSTISGNIKKKYVGRIFSFYMQPAIPIWSLLRISEQNCNLIFLKRIEKEKRKQMLHYWKQKILKKIASHSGS